MNIPIKNTLLQIIHEVYHFLDDRKREERLVCAKEVISNLLVKSIRVTLQDVFGQFSFEKPESYNKYMIKVKALLNELEASLKDLFMKILDKQPDIEFTFLQWKIFHNSDIKRFLRFNVEEQLIAI